MSDQHAPTRELTDAEVRAVRPLTRPHQRSLWGVPHRVTPVLIRTVFGDGGQVVGLQPMDTRPNYYVVLIDAGWDLDNWHWDAPLLFIDQLDQVLEAIEDEHGSGRWCRRCGEEDDARHPLGHVFRTTPWPALHDETGCSWFALERPGTKVVVMNQARAHLAARRRERQEVRA